RLRDDARDEARAASVFSGDAADDDLLFLDDLGVEVRTERAARRVGNVDAVDEVHVVGRGAGGAVDVGVVDARTRGRVAARRGLNARNELQVRLVVTAGGQRFHGVEGQRRADGG